MKISAPFAGIVHYKVQVGHTVAAGQEVASVEALKLESPIIAPSSGVVTALSHADFADVVGGDELLVLDESSAPNNK